MHGCVFSYIDVTSEAGGWMVPQMILHTFVENIYKHVVSADRMVTLLVRAEVVYEPMISDERLLCLIVEDDGKLVWECPQCGNRNQDKMNVARRTCGYIGTQFWNQGRTQEIKERVLHL